MDEVKACCQDEANLVLIPVDAARSVRVCVVCRCRHFRMAASPGQLALKGAPIAAASDVTLTVTLHPDGKLTVAGPLADRALCVGLLEHARLEIERFDPQQPPGERAS
jgi:hypothetical protein